SGGMVGASYWVATLPGVNGHDHPPEQDQAFVERVAQDSLSPVAQRLLFVDVPMIFIPRSGTGDRGVALEQAWQRNMGGALDKSFGELAAGEAEGWRPSLVLS